MMLGGGTHAQPSVGRTGLGERRIGRVGAERLGDGAHGKARPVVLLAQMQGHDTLRVIGHKPDRGLGALRVREVSEVALHPRLQEAGIPSRLEHVQVMVCLDGKYPHAVQGASCLFGHNARV